MNESWPRQVSISDEVIFQEIEGECVLLNMATEQYYGLDDVGTRIWQLLSEYGKPVAVLEQLRQHYRVDEGTLRRDLGAFIAELQAEGLVKVEAVAP
ncbi:MAG TPA: PqqD family protein [Blastocatellia bacterium]|nr:PqqD family protein [Blastocatellia bacterium]